MARLGTDEAVFRSLDFHEDRRTAGVPTLSVLLGSAMRGSQAFNSWARARGLWVGTVSIADSTELTRELTTALGAHPDLHHRAIRAVADAAQTTEESVLALVDCHSQDALQLFRRAATSGADGALGCTLLGRGPQDAGPRLSLLVELLNSATQRPALLVAQLARSAQYEGLQEVERLLSAAPALALGVVLEREICATSDPLGTHADSRWMTMLKDGLIHLPAEAIPEAPKDLPEQHVSARAQLIAEGASAAAIRAFDQASCISPPTSAPEEHVARSRQEALLHQLLQERAETSGLFELNGKMGFDFGNRPMEVDLVSRRLGIAIEIDGYYHFQGKDAYRRDRRKDALLQQHGYWVLRHLADDIPTRLQTVLNSIIERVKLRKQERAA